MTVEASSCCRGLPHVNASAPFSKAIAFGYYDGGTSGVAQCGTCSSVYRYEMIDQDAQWDVRVFALAPMPATSLDELVEACQPLGTPRWPLWVPLWRFPDAAQERRVEDTIGGLLRMAGLVHMVVAADDIVEVVKAARSLEPRERFEIDSPPAGKDWLALLGLERERGRPR